jgi:hypothetical protein
MRRLIASVRAWKLASSPLLLQMQLFF